MEKKTGKGSCAVLFIVSAIAICAIIMLMAQVKDRVFASEKKSSFLRLRVTADFTTLDPAFIRAPTDHAIGSMIYDTLVRVFPGDDKIYPCLAEKWEVSADGKQFTFHLRKGVKWHRDYGTLNADDVVWSLKRHTEKKTGSFFAGDFRSVSSIKALDDSTVRITLSNPDPDFLSGIIAYRPGFIVSQKAIEKLGDSYMGNAVGSGPYMLENWVPRDRIVLRKNPNYWGTTGTVETATFFVIPEDTTFAMALQSRNVDIGYVSSVDVIKSLSGKSGITILKEPSQRVYYLQMNTQQSPTNSKEVRQAIWWGLDRDTISKHLFAGTITPTDTIIGAKTFGVLNERIYSYDPGMAKKLLASAGFPKGFSLPLVFWSADEMSLNLATAIQAQLQVIGIDIKLQGLEWGQVVEAHRQETNTIFLKPHLRITPDQFVGQILHSRSIPYPNGSRYKGADELIDKARTENDANVRRQLYHAVQRKIHEDAPVIPIGYPQFVIAARSNIKGVRVGLQDFILWEISVAQD